MDDPPWLDLIRVIAGLSTIHQIQCIGKIQLINTFDLDVRGTKAMDVHWTSEYNVLWASFHGPYTFQHWLTKRIQLINNYWWSIKQLREARNMCKGHFISAFFVCSKKNYKASYQILILIFNIWHYQSTYWYGCHFWWVRIYWTYSDERRHLAVVHFGRPEGICSRRPLDVWTSRPRDFWIRRLANV